MKKLFSRLIRLLSILLLTQTSSLGQVKWNESNSSTLYAKIYPERIILQTPVKPLISLTPAKIGDTLWLKRRFCTTIIYLNKAKMSNFDLNQLYQFNLKAKRKFQLGNGLKPLGPLVAISGLVVGYIGIKGNPAIAIVRGQRTPTNPNVPDVQVEYTKRSLPKVLGGLGLFLGGLCLIEVSNELTAMSVTLFNSKSSVKQSLSQLDNLKLGLTTHGSIGLQAQF